MKKILLSLISFYQKIPLFNHQSCRYSPTCSQYTCRAVKKYGIIQGGLMGLRRISHCHPWAKGGLDPIP